MLKKRIWIVLAVVLLIAVCAVWCFADGPWNWMQRLYFEDIRSAAAWAHVPEWEQRELADDELAKLLFLLSKLDRDDFTKNRQLAGGTPEFGLVIKTETATYRINQSIAPDGEMEISRLGDDGLWWIDEDELADFVKSVLPERTISVPEQPKEPVQPQEPEKPAEKPEEPVIPEPDDDAQKKNAALKRLSNLQPEEIVEIEYPSADRAELAALIRKVAANPVERTEDKSMFEIWGLWVDMTTNADGAGREELLRLYASPEEENVVKLYCRSGTRENTTLCLEDSELYWFVRNRYSTKDVIDEAAIAPYYEILAARAQKTVDESANWHGAQPLSGYEILSFEQVDSFEKDGANYVVFEWDVAFLTENPAKVGWAGGMWLDSRCRVRALEQCTYFVVCNFNGQTDCEFFWYDLYTYCQKGMTQQESAHWEIERLFTQRADDACPLTEISLSLEEYGAASRAVLIDLRTGWWNGNSAPLFTYESGAFECLHREVVDGKLLLYGYGGYYAWDASDECVLSRMSETIVTLDAATLQTVDIWWPGDGAAHESAMMACFPESIAAAVVEHAMDHYGSANIRLMERAMSNRLPVGVMQSVPETRSFTRLGFRMEVTGVLSARRMNMLAEGIELHEYVELSCVPGAEITILNADMSDPAYSRDKKAHPNWGLYYTGETEQTRITDETGTVLVTPDLEGVYNLEASLFVFKTTIVQ